MDDEADERQLNIHVDAENYAGDYANYAHVSFSPYEFTITFAQIDYETEEREIPGIVVSRIHLPPPFVRELIEALTDAWSRYTTAQGIKNLPETEPHSE